MSAIDNLSKIIFDDEKFKINTNIDLNNLFNLNYNFDLLKGIIEQLLKNQKALSDHLQLLTKEGDIKDNKIMKLERDVNDLKTNQIDKDEFDQMKADFDKIKEHLALHDNEIAQINERLKKLEELEDKINKLSDKIDLHDDKLENFINEGNNRNIYQNIDLGNNEANDFEKLKMIITNLRKDLDKTKEITNNNQLDIKNIMKSLDEMEKDYNSSDNNLQKQIDDLKNYCESKLMELATQMELALVNPNNIKGDSKVSSGDLKIITDLIKRITELENKFRDMNKGFNTEEILKEIDNLKKQMKDKADQIDLNNLREQFDFYVTKINELSKDLENLANKVEANESDIKSLKDQMDYINKLLENLKLAIENIKIKGGKKSESENGLADLFKVSYDGYVKKDEFYKYKQNMDDKLNDMTKDIDKLKKLVEELFQIKADKKDLEDFKDFLLAKLDELAIACNKKFADKNETAKALKYLENQIKKIISMIMNMNKCEHSGDNWLLAKKPLFGFSCASCESYIGELKDNTQYIPWNKYPIRDPNDKLYRIGNGFSKMLQMLNLESNSENNENTNIHNNHNNCNQLHNSKTTANFFSGKVKNCEDNNVNNNSNGNNNIDGKYTFNRILKRGNSVEGNDLPKLNKSNNYKADNKNNPYLSNIKDDDNEPKVTKITKIRKLNK